MPPRILFVCAANVCRSPVMAYAFHDAVDPQLEWQVTSRGAVADGGRPLCSVASRLLTRRDALAPGLTAHTSRRVSARDVSSADLIITASRPERGAIARLDPDARTRTFTLREATALIAVAEGEGDDLRAKDLRVLAARLNSRRGTAIVLDGRDRAWGGPRVDADDIPDVHHGGVLAHRRVLARTADAAVALARVVSSSLAPADRAEAGR